MRKVNTTIKYIEPYSIAEDAGIEVGDKLISINGHDFHDILEYRYLTAEYEVTLSILCGISIISPIGLSLSWSIISPPVTSPETFTPPPKKLFFIA